MRLMLALAVLVLDLWAISSVLASRAGTLRRLLWTVLIVAVPVAGALAWFVRNSSTRRSG